MRAIPAKASDVREAVDGWLLSKGVDTEPRRRLVETFMAECQRDIATACVNLSRVAKRYLQEAGETAHSSQRGRVFVGATDSLVYLAAGEKAKKELPPLDLNDQEDRETFAELVEQRVRTAKRHGETLSFASAAEAVMRTEFGGR